MKKQIKPIILSAAAALTFGGIAVGTTFALFTSKAETNVTVQSGTVKIEQTSEIKNVFELNNTSVTPTEGVYTNSIGGKTYLDSENSGLLHLEKWAPGDKAVIEIRNTNKSNVAIRSRFSITHSSTSSVDLYDALKVSYVAYDADDNDITYLVDDWGTFEPTEDTSVGYLLSRVVVTIEFPDGDDGEILFGDDNHDNQYQDSNCSIYFTQEAVQGNAYTPALIDILNEQLAESAQVNKTMFDALSEVELEANAAHYKRYVWDSLEDQFYYDYSVTPSERYFKVYKEAPVDQTFSIYAEGWTTPSTLELDGVGFDAGNSTLFTAINYVNTSGVAKTNIIRTNSASTNLTINAANDTIKHYGEANVITLAAVSVNSYYENGSVNQVNIKKGRLVLSNKEEASVESVYIQATEDAYDDIVIATQSGAELPNVITRDNVALPDGSNTKKVVTIQTNVDIEGKNPEKTEIINLYSTKGTIGNDVYEAENGYDVSDLALLVVEASSDDAKAQAAQQISDPEVVEQIEEVKTIYEVSNLAEFNAAINAKAKHIKLLADITTATSVYVLDFDTLIEGEGHTFTSSANRVFRIAGNNRTITFRNIDMVSTYSGSDSRVVSIDSNYDTINLTIDSCRMTCGYYALNITGVSGSGSKNINIGVYGSTIQGYAAINNHANSCSITVNNSTLIGLNDKSAGTSNSFATIVFDGGNYEYQESYSFGSKIVVNNSTVKQITYTTNYEVAFSSQYGNVESEAHFNNCTFEHEGENAKYLNYAYPKTNNVKIFIDGELVYEGKDPEL